MNDQELEKLLRSNSPPKRDEAYWREFPSFVSRQIRTQDQIPARRRETSFTVSFRWIRNIAIAGAAAAIVLVTEPWSWRTSRPHEPLLSLRTCYAQVADLFPNQVEAVILNADGIRLQLSDTPTVPESPPVFVRLCAPSGVCISAVSYSGQRIRVEGSEFEILADGAGQIFLLSQKGILTSGPNPGRGDGWRVESGWLEQN